MAFCGQCGYQLRSGDMACPRCGMVTEPMITAYDTDATNADSPTVALPERSAGAGWRGDGPTQSNTPPQQPAIYYPIDNTPVTNPPNYAGTNISHPGFSSQPGSSHPGYAPVSYPGTSQPGVYDPATRMVPPPKRGGRIFLILLVVLLALALAASFLWYFLYGRTPPTVNTPTPTAQATTAAITPTTAPTLTPTLPPAQQAQSVVQQYYDDINNRDYQAAYNLLGAANQSSQPYGQFSSGYAHTRHDTITFNSITPQNDGTVTVIITLQALEDAKSGTGTQMSTYHLSYVVGQENGAWKMLSGQSV